MTGLRLVYGELDQLPRLRAFRKSHPHVVIGTLGSGGVWQARVPDGNGETVITRHHLRHLLDRLSELLGEVEPERHGD